ncbi:CDP-glycerol glycerophosphotransferase family protein [Motilimonas cestriensis]|uniref:CDP-glycerol glycerophosphotransferase family protein n=1 Tax=Motilimonas cestriensis TaxID=2742685 RepID=A0ABS8W980_9GAMM|nr:CDP-glycerol glycerophosphotransferase family protein [Motilimonas cestriensis]MCE2595567.1 CDP-glycerol glycerophosphotransferase family protein [Motilimonas cestriensis]
MNKTIDLRSETTLYVAPANPAGLKLYSELKRNGLNVLGIVDNLKTGHDILSPHQLPNNGKVIVAWGSFQNIVAEQLHKNGVEKSNILTIDATGVLKSYRPNIKSRLLTASKFTFNLCTKLLRRIPLRISRVYYSESFVDTNVLLCYLSDEQSTKKKLIVDKESSLPESVKGISFEHSPIKAYFHMLFARSFIIDHEYHSLIFTSLRKEVPVIQLWHGLPYKSLSGNQHYPEVDDACFISSSAWFNENIFSHIFKSRKFLDLGYPRNDVFFQSKNERNWINSEPLSKLESIIAITGELIIYAPTFRDSHNNESPLNLREINSWCNKNKYSFILKYHPFIYRLMADKTGISESNDIVQLPDYKHIYFFPNGKNIYPWLAESKALITDYSSISFDYMLAKKPIIYFQYDKDEYLKIRGKPLVSDDLFINGQIVLNMEQLLPTLEQALSEGEVHHNQAKLVQSKPATTNILDAINHLESTC